VAHEDKYRSYSLGDLLGQEGMSFLIRDVVKHKGM
jgi:hypothetical protein